MPATPDLFEKKMFRNKKMVYSAAYQKNAVRGNLEHMPREQTVKTEIARFYNSSFSQRKKREKKWRELVYKELCGKE